MPDPPSLGEVLDHFNVEYRHRGGNYAILCFAHEESRPSCVINNDKGVFHCKSCLAQGGVYDAIMILAKLGSRREAAEWASENGLGEGDGSTSGERRPRRAVPQGARFRPRFGGRGQVPPWRRGVG